MSEGMSARRASMFHATSTIVVALGVALAALAASAMVAIEEARIDAAAIAGTVAQAVASPLTAMDIADADPGMHEVVLEGLRPFIDSGIIDRVKVWRVDGDEAVVLFSDEPRNEGTRRPFDAALAARLDSGEVVVFDVPDDAEHRYEFGRTGTLEAFIGFNDATGRPLRLELYVASAAPETLGRLFGATLPIALLGPLVLGAATLPLSLRLVRRVATHEEQRRRLLQTALAASDRERRHLAGRLHDGIIQSLASVGLTLEGLERSTEPGSDQRAAMLSRASILVDEDLAKLRALLTELAPPELDGSLETALRDLAEDYASAAMLVDLRITASVEVSGAVAALLYRAARELVRNAIDHAAPRRIAIELDHTDGELILRVIDDGRGFDPDEPVAEGHLGLSLIRQAVIDSNGAMDLTTSSDGTCVVVRVPVDVTERVLRASRTMV
ncbi:MAG: hypothetical protein KF680_08280 [Cryobacterium sp.]|nr:hypothetical protein [Cryobacterium sp.]